MKQKRWLRALVFAAVPALLLVFAPREMADGVRDGLTLCGTVVIPSLFPFFVLCTFVTRTGLSADLGRLLAPVTEKAFRLPGAAAGAILLGLCGGYPLGARMTSQLLERREVTQPQAERMCLFLVTAGPVFVTGTVGAGMLHSAAAGRLLLAAVTLGCLTLGLLLRFTDDAPTPVREIPRRDGVAESLCAAVADGGKGMLSMCAWVILFSGVCRACARLPAGAGTAAGYLLEVTGGCRLAIENGLPLPLIAGILGFGGLSVQCQILPYVTACGVKPSRFWAFRVLSGGLAAVYAAALLRIFPHAEPAALLQGQTLRLSGASVSASVSLLCTAAVFILNTAPDAEKSAILRKS